MEITVFQEGYGSSNSYIGYDPETKEAFIVDPSRDDDSYLNYLRDKGLKLEKILLTHAHFDHVGGIDRLKKETGATVYASADEKPVMENAQVNLTGMTGSPKIIEADVYVQPGEKIKAGGDELEIIATPGHTPGSICYYTPEGVLFSGDTIFEGSIGRTDFPGGSYSDIQDSLSKITKLPESTQILPGHGNMTTVGQEKRTNPFIV